MEWFVAIVFFGGLFALMKHERKETQPPDYSPNYSAETIRFESPEDLYEAASIFEQNRFGRELPYQGQNFMVVLTDNNSGFQRNWDGWNYARTFFNHPIPEFWTVIDHRSPSECGPSPIEKRIEALPLRIQRDRERVAGYHNPETGKVLKNGGRDR